MSDLVQRSKAYLAYPPANFPDGVGLIREFVAASAQTEVDWSVVCEAVHDAADVDGIGPRALEASFKSCGLLVMHRDDAVPLQGTDCKNEGAKVGADGECLSCNSEAGETCQRTGL